MMPSHVHTYNAQRIRTTQPVLRIIHLTVLDKSSRRILSVRGLWLKTKYAFDKSIVRANHLWMGAE